MLNTELLFLNIGGPEMIMIFLVVLLLFGGKKLPELARGLGKGLREFKDASDGIKREIHNNINAVNDTVALDQMDTPSPPSYSASTSVDEAESTNEDPADLDGSHSADDQDSEPLIEDKKIAH